MAESPDDGSQESGFSLIEIIISMFLLALLTVSFLPLVIQTLRTSAKNTTLATATRLVSDQMETIRATGGTCSSYAGMDRDGGLARSAVVDPRGVTLEVRADLVGTCPTIGGVFTYVVWVNEQGTPTTRLAEATTLVAVDAS